jgi:hypothetical protein
LIPKNLQEKLVQVHAAEDRTRKILENKTLQVGVPDFVPITATAAR